MDLASLAVFRTVAREQSITRAAELLGRVPSNVTTRVQQLEAEIGVPLFQRDRKRMTLTAEGVTYLDYAERILNLAEEARQIVNPAEPGGTLRIGSMESAVAARLPAPLAQFSARWPDVTLDVSTAPTRQLVESLLAHRIDCALIAIPAGDGWLDPDELDIVPLFREELVLLLPPGHPQVEVSEDIRPRALAAFSPGCTYRMLAEDWITRGGSRPAQLRFQEIKSYHAMVACTAAGSCFSVLPRSVLELVPDAARFTIQPLERFPIEWNHLIDQNSLKSKDLDRIPVSIKQGYGLTVDTWLASRPGFGTRAFAAFREQLQAASNIGYAGDAPK